MTIKGITLSGLQGNSFGGATYKTAAVVKSEIDAAKTNFGADTIRLQIQQQLLVGDGTQYDATYHATVDDVASYVLSSGLTLVLNCQTEPGPSRTGAYYPNQTNSATNAFWAKLAPTYNGNASVIFDLFNEPRCTDNPPGTNWTRWQSVFNALISYMRTTLGITNVLWADADDYAASFAGCPGLTDPSSNLVYSFHHPPSAAGGNTAGWDTDFGNWAATHPVVNGEFAQNANFNWGSAYDISAYLDYLNTKGIGQTLWTVFGDNYFSDSSNLPYGWWGHIINNRWQATGYTTYVFRSSVKWSQNYRKSQDDKLSWTGGLYQGWSAAQNSMLCGACSFNDMTARFAEGTRWRMWVATKVVDCNGPTLSARLGVHAWRDNIPTSYTALAPVTGIVTTAGLTSGQYFTMPVPASYLSSFANATYRGICFGPGPDATTVYQGHTDYSPELVLEVAA